MDSHLLLQLYQKQGRLISYYLKKNGCSHEDAEDIVQESFTKYIQYSSGVATDKVFSYIFSIALNQFRNLLKKQGREQVVAIDGERFWNNIASDENIEYQILQNEKRQRIMHQLNVLPETYKQLLLLKYEFELTYKEISLLLGMKEETVRTYLYRARKEFQKKWSDFS